MEPLETRASKGDRRVSGDRMSEERASGREGDGLERLPGPPRVPNPLGMSLSSPSQEQEPDSSLQDAPCRRAL